MNTGLQKSHRMTKTIETLAKKHGILSIEYKQHTVKHFQNGKYYDTAECISLKTGRIFLINHYGEITEGEKPVNLRRDKAKKADRPLQYAIV